MISSPLKALCITGITAIFLMICTHTTHADKKAYPFGDSLEWSSGKYTPSLDAMRGKSVLIIFFQSWCGICNEWSGNFFSQLEKAYGDDPRVVLIAIKTDGGSVKDAIKYLESRIKPEKWLVASDEEASYYIKATGQDSLYQYLWISPDGKIEVGKAGSYYTKENSEEYVLASKKMKSQVYQNTSLLIPNDPLLPDACQPAIRMAEQGLVSGTLDNLEKLRDPEVRDHVAAIQQAIESHLEKAITAHSTVLDDPNDKNRYLSYISLLRMADEFERLTPGRSAKEAASKHASASWISTEENALRDYEKIQRRVAKAEDDRDREKINRAYKKLAKEFPDTYYGRLASSSVK